MQNYRLKIKGLAEAGKEIELKLTEIILKGESSNALPKI